MVNSAIASAAYLTPENLATEEEYFEDLAATDPEKARELALAWKQKKGEEPSAEG